MCTALNSLRLITPKTNEPLYAWYVGARKMARVDDIHYYFVFLFKLKVIYTSKNWRKIPCHSSRLVSHRSCKKMLVYCT